MRYLKSSIFISIFLIIFGPDIHAQKIFREGYIIKKSGETLNGLIEYTYKKRIPVKCVFKRFDIANKITYSADNISAFGYRNGNRYESKKLESKNSFFEVLVSGKITLYYKNSKYYIEKDHNWFTEIKKGPITFNDGKEEKVFADISEFLNFITEGKTGKISNILNVEKEIIPLIISYNKSSGSPYFTYNRSMPDQKISRIAFENGINNNRFGILAGVYSYKMNIIPNKYYENLLPLTSRVSDNVFGISYERQLSRYSDRFSLKIDVICTKQSFYNYQKKDLTTSYISRNDWFYDFKGIKIPVLFQYSFTGKKNIPFIDFGIAYQKFIKENYLQLEEVEYTTLKEVDTHTYSDYHLRKEEYTVTGGVGIKIKLNQKMCLELQSRIEVGPGLFKDIPISQVDGNPIFKNNSFQTIFLAGISF